MDLMMKFLILFGFFGFMRCQIADPKTNRLKNELLANLNKYSSKTSETLEVLGTPVDAIKEEEDARNRKEEFQPLPSPMPMPTLASFPPTPGLDLFNLFQPSGPSIFGNLPNIFNGILPVPTTSPPMNLLNIQPIPFGGRQRFHQSEPPTIFPTLPLLPIQNGVPNGNPTQVPEEADGTAVIQPTFLNHSSVPAKTMPEAVSQNIHDWRQRFYKAFRKLSGKHTHPTTTQPPLNIQPLSRPNYTSRMQPVVVLDDTKAPVVDKNLQVLMARKHPNWNAERQVKTYARDSKGRIVRLFGVESSGYNATYPNTNGFIPIPGSESLGLPTQNVDIGPVYIPAARPITEFSPMDPVLANYAEPTAPPSPKVYTVAMPAPPSVAPAPFTLASYPEPTTMSAPLPPNDAQLTNDVDTVDYEPNYVAPQTPCTYGCQTTNPWGENGMVENTEKCNSLRLRYIIQESIINGDAEASKKAIQIRAEAELGRFYNVICGTGFFSYIAHTDEFCLTSAMNINCYVFSPVCTWDLQMGTGLAKKRKMKRRNKKVVVNRN